MEAGLRIRGARGRRQGDEGAWFGGWRRGGSGPVARFQVEQANDGEREGDDECDPEGGAAHVSAFGSGEVGDGHGRGAARDVAGEHESGAVLAEGAGEGEDGASNDAGPGERGSEAPWVRAASARAGLT